MTLVNIEKTLLLQAIAAMLSPPDRVTHSLLYAGMLLIWYSATLLVGALPNFALLQSHGLVMPVLCLLEFALLLPLYRWYRRHHTDIPLGKLLPRQMVIFTVLLLLLIVIQSLYMQREHWISGQFDTSKYSVVLFALSVVLLAPVYEEILFRGFILQGFMLWVPGQRIVGSLLTSITFAVVHTQYVHLQTLVALILLSLLMCAARLLSGGLKLPIFLHTLNNLLGITPWLWLTFNH